MEKRLPKKKIRPKPIKNRKSSSQEQEQRILPRKSSSQEQEQRKALHDLAAARLVKRK